MTNETATMRSIIQDEYGVSPDAVLRLALVARPEIGADDVLVRVRAASVDRGTWHMMSGLPYPMRAAGFGLRSPKAPNPGRSFAGTVESVGANVTGLAAGDAVFGICEGAFAEFARARASKVALMPERLSFEAAAAVPVSGLTALQALRKAHTSAGHQVLIIGASGGVGSFAVQLAKSLGAEVTGVCRAAKAGFVRGLGADHVIDYASDALSRITGRYDAILDIGGMTPLSELRRMLTARGRLVAIGGENDHRWIWANAGRQLKAALVSPFLAQSLTSMLASENAADLSALSDLIDSGDLTPAIDKTLSLEETGDAISYVQEGRASGKVVVRI